MRINPKPSVLASLSEEQQEQLMAWLELHPFTEVIDKVAAPPPDGFGIRTHPNSLKRYFARRRLNNFPDNSALAADLLASAAGAPDLNGATEASLRQLAFELVNSPAGGLKNFKALLPRQRDRMQFVARDFDRRRGAKSAHSRQRSVNDEQRSRRSKAPQESVFYPAVWGVSGWILKLRDQDRQLQQLALSRERLDLDNKKFLFNAARAALEHHAELGEILKKDDLDSEDKINAARSVLFQIPINELPK